MSTIDTSTVSTAAIRAELLAFIARTFMVQEEEIDLDNSMIDEGIIDSFGLVEIVAWLETTYHISIDEHEVIRANFGSVNKITAFIHGKTAHAAS